MQQKANGGGIIPEKLFTIIRFGNHERWKANGGEIMPEKLFTLPFDTQESRKELNGRTDAALHSISAQKSISDARNFEFSVSYPRCARGLPLAFDAFDGI